MQLQLSLTLADGLYDLLLMSGEPIDFMDAARRLLSLKEAPEALCRDAMDTLVTDDRRFCWSSPTTLGLNDWGSADPDLADVTFVVVDLETTGTRPGLSKITEIGAVRIEGLRQVAVFETLVNPQRSIPPKVVEITGITPAMLVGAPRIEEVMPHFLDFLDGAVVVAHNAPFDLGFLNYELSRLRGRRLGDGAIDTVPLSRATAPGLPNHRLGTVAEAFGSPVAANHRALADAAATAHVFLTCVGRLQERGITRLNELRSFIDPGHKRDRHKLALTRDLPRAPGTYLFRDAEGEVLYVGKADRLRDRVNSYFLASADHPRKVRQAVRRLQHVDYELTHTPLRAVVREQELILQHRPPCNVLGRRPENYCYVKVSGKGPGLRLYVTDRPGAAMTRRNGGGGEDPGRPGEATRSGRAAAPAMIGPFRGRTRVKAAIELLQKIYPVRQCRGVRGEGPCLYGQTGACLAPCTGDTATLEHHDELVGSLITWLTGGPTPSSGDPQERGRTLRDRLAKSRRYEEAQEVHEALDHLATVRRSYGALAEATALRAAVLWPEIGADGTRTLQLDVVWRGVLRTSTQLTPATASLEIGRAVRSLPDPVGPDPDAAPEREDAGPADLEDTDGRRAVIAVPQEELDLLLAVRRWIIDAPPASVVPFPSRTAHREAVEEWRRALVATALDLLQDQDR